MKQLKLGVDVLMAYYSSSTRTSTTSARVRRTEEKARSVVELTVCTGNLEVKLKAPSGTNVTVKGKQGFDGVTTGSVCAHRVPATMQWLIMGFAVRGESTPLKRVRHLLLLLPHAAQRENSSNLLL